MKTVEIDVREVTVSGTNPRRFIERDALEELKESLRSAGLLQPVGVRPSENGYELAFGLRRLTALRELVKEDESFAKVTAVVIDGDDDSTSVAQLAENLHRRGNKPSEIADAIAYLHNERGVSVPELSKKLAMASSTVRRYLTLTKCEEYVRALEDSVTVYDEREVGGEVLKLPRKAPGLSLMQLTLLNKLDRALRKNDRARAKDNPKAAPRAEQTVLKIARQAAENGWSFRRLQQEVTREFEALSGSTKAKPRTPSRALSKGPSWLTLRDVGREPDEATKKRILEEVNAFLTRIGVAPLELD